MGCNLLIKKSIKSFTKTELKVANYILENGELVVYMSTEELSKVCNVSAATIIRFSQKLGYSGFSDFKLDLAADTRCDSKEDFETFIKDGDSMEVTIKKTEKIYLHNAAQTYQMVNISILLAIVDIIKKSKHIYLFGIGASGLLAMDFQYKLSRIGIQAIYTLDGHTNLSNAALAKSDDCALIISYSGETQEALLAAKAAQSNNCPIVAITQPNRNSLSRIANYSLYIPSDEKEFRVGAMMSRNAGLIILDLLYLGIAKCSPREIDRNLHLTHDIIRKLKKK